MLILPGSIVAVHGFGGPLHTWTHDMSGKLWLRDFLPKDLPGARIMSFGYDSMVVNSKSIQGMIENVGELLLQLRYRRLSPEVWIRTRKVSRKSADRLQEQHRPIIFIGHSLGGFLIKRVNLMKRFFSFLQSLSSLFRHSSWRNKKQDTTRYSNLLALQFLWVYPTTAPISLS